MKNRFDWSRRGALAGLGALLAASSAAARGRQRALVSINMAEVAPGPPAPAPDKGALLETAFDQALRMTVPIRLNGKGPFAFVVDTGANRSVVSSEAAKACGLPIRGSTPLHGIAGVETADLVEVARLRVGQVSSSNLQLPMLPAARLGADGLLGVDMLRNRRVDLDFSRSKFEISPSDIGASVGRAAGSRLPELGGPVTIPARYRFGQLVIFDAEVVGRPVVVFLDSGSQVTVGNSALRRAVLQAQPDLASRFQNTELLSATGQTATAELALLPDLRIGGQLINNLVAAFADLHIFDLWNLTDRPAVLIGVDVLRRFDHVALDFGRREVSFWPPRSAHRLRSGG